jgi:1-acyl-sn-glycerol-3-phosphate acyltransferase
MFFFITVSGVIVSLLFSAFVNRVAYVIHPRLGRRFNRYLSTVLCRRVFSLVGTYMNFHFRGERHLVDELPDQYLIMSNHQGMMDIPLYMRFLDGPRLRFVAKAELGRGIPLISLMLRANQHCLVNRASATQAMRAMDTFAERVKENNWIPVIFPEGTRSSDGKLGTFHAAGFRRFLDKAPMPVAVCAVDGGWKVGTVEGIRKNMSGGSYRVRVLKIYPAPRSKAEQVAILEEGKALIEEQLKVWRALG